MPEPKWRIAHASVIGTSHQKNGTICQDTGYCQIIYAVDGNDILLAVASDGAGSATRSEIGSQLAVDSFLQQFGEAAMNMSLSKIDRPFVLNWLKNLNAKIQEKADQEKIETKEFACTILAAIVDLDDAIFFQIGDGAIVVSELGSIDYGHMFWPQHGEFANQTNFLTQDNIAETLEFAYVKRTFETVSIFTDGIERLVLDFPSKSVHPPALRPILDWLAKCEPSTDESSSAALIAYLSSDLINSRTDDDKTLVMATRAPA